MKDHRHQVRYLTLVGQLMGVIYGEQSACENRLSFREAWDCCQQHGNSFRPYTVKTHDDHQGIISYLQDRNINSAWINLKRHTFKDWKWINNSVLEMQFVLGSAGNCGVLNMRTKQLGTTACAGNKTGFLCQKRECESCSFLGPESPKCFWVESICFIFSCGATDRDWYSARSYCQRKGWELAIVRDDTVINTFKEKDWQGADELCKAVWIGFHKEDWFPDGKDGAPEEVFWADKEPSPNGKCTVIKKLNGDYRWLSSSCDEKNYVVCKASGVGAVPAEGGQEINFNNSRGNENGSRSDHQGSMIPLWVIPVVLVLLVITAVLSIKYGPVGKLQKCSIVYIVGKASTGSKRNVIDGNLPPETTSPEQEGKVTEMEDLGNLQQDTTNPGQEENVIEREDSANNNLISKNRNAEMPTSLSVDDPPPWIKDLHHADRSVLCHHDLNEEQVSQAVLELSGKYKTLRAVHSTSSTKLQLIFDSYENAEVVRAEGVKCLGKTLETYSDLPCKPVRVSLIGVPLDVLNCRITDELEKYGRVVKNCMNVFWPGTELPTLEREALVILEKELPGSIELNENGRQFVVDVSLKPEDWLKREEEEHITRDCLHRNSDEGMNQDPLTRNADNRPADDISSPRQLAQCN